MRSLLDHLEFVNAEAVFHERALSDGLGAGSAAPYLASHMRSQDAKPRFRVGVDGGVIDDDDFLFDALIRIEGYFGEGARLAYAQWMADALNEADKKLPREPRGA